jgi:hypothetical protein
VSFSVPATLLGYTDVHGEFALEPARVDWVIGLAADDHRASGHFNIVGTRRPLRSEDRAFFSETVVR